MTIKDSHGFWRLLTLLEKSAIPRISSMLKPFEPIITDLYECGIEAPTLVKPSSRKYLGVTGLLLKRLLNDIRAVWLLLLFGYTSQAASIAAAAMENALIICCVTTDHRKAARLMESGSSPWSVYELCRMHDSGYKWLKKKKKDKDDIDLETASRGDYAVYQWICKFKHPHMVSVLHDAYSVAIEDTYGIMAAPDDRIEDLPNKIYILEIMIIFGCDAINSLVEAKALEEGNPKVVAWQKRFSSIVGNFEEIMKNFDNMNLPFDYKGRMRKPSEFQEHHTD